MPSGRDNGRIAWRSCSPPAGVEVRLALRVGLFRRRSARADLRNHRKIAIIDSRVGYVGSQNITNAVSSRNIANEELVARKWSVRSQRNSKPCLSPTGSWKPTRNWPCPPCFRTIIPTPGSSRRSCQAAPTTRMPALDTSWPRWFTARASVSSSRPPTSSRTRHSCRRSRPRRCVESKSTWWFRT
ncbi:hypothetical protein [Allomesorhizobium alhagi]|uniref:hypothetical protein n=1 Tax=Allomesorhizobium alhagi TaxID=475067 RepID=UPI001FCA6F8F|nr:hypothetical protein [Mesorhizobium alhagi]